MHRLTQIATVELAAFLKRCLPPLGENWWKNHVEDRLSFQQQRMVREQGMTMLSQLDLAALLRVMDRNWQEISQSLDLPWEGRSWLKELQNVRNRWAHLSAVPMRAEDSYRDADTLARFLAMIGASPDSAKAVEAVKANALAGMVSPASPIRDLGSSSTGTAASIPAPADRPPGDRAKDASAGIFEIGNLVALRSDPATAMPVLAVHPGGAETSYQVFHNGKKATYYESQLQLYDENAEPTRLTAEELRAFLTSLHLLSQSTAYLYSLRSGRIEFQPYQYRPALKLIRADRPRLLIADEVGVGKTIEAGLILKELQARRDVSSVLVICPKALVAERKWDLEMKRFDEEFEVLDGPTLRHCLRETHMEGEWPERHAKVIVPFSLFDSNLLFGTQGMLALDPPPKFDLVIVDEAHHIRNADTFLHQGVRHFCEHAEAAVFLTATPVQLGSRDLYTLLNVLRPDLVIDRPSFEQMSEPNRFINTAIGHCRSAADRWQDKARDSLEEAAATEWGQQFLRDAPAFQNAYDRLEESDIDSENRVRLVRSLEELYTFSPMINRTRRKDIGKFAMRRPHTVKVEFTPDQCRLHDALLDVVGRILERTHGQQNVKFMMTTLRRQAASCLYGLAPFLRDLLEGKLDNLEATEAPGSEAVVDTKFLDEIKNDVKTLINPAENLDPHDPKVDEFIKVLRGKSQMDANKVLVFSTFRHTLAYLERHVVDARLRYGVIHGGIPDEERSKLRRRFALGKDDPDALDVLLSSEVGSEGLDFQFCDLLVNYDLPWNPMRIEQRIGRIDRYGQKSDSVAIVNLVTRETVDEDIYDRCLVRIGVFEDAVGGSEQILGEFAQEIRDIAENYKLTPDLRAERLQQLSDNKLFQLQEEAKLEDSQAELCGLTVPPQSWRADIAEAENSWLSPAALQHCVTCYLSNVADIPHNFLLGAQPLMTLRLNRDVRSALLTDFRDLPRSTDPAARNWEKWLKEDSQHLQVTFEQETGAAETKSTYLNVLHPLVRQAAKSLQQSDVVQVSLMAQSDTVSPGLYAFALYQWRKVGIQNDDEIVAIASVPDLEVAIMSLLSEASNSVSGEYPVADAIRKIDNRHHARWNASRANHMEQTLDFVRHREHSLAVSHRARRLLLETQIADATDHKFRRMREGQLANAERDYRRRAKGLQEQAGRADIHATRLVEGLIEVTPLTSL